VLGGQSAGKSSVLESIVGLDFLPRGDGVVTRRPLELRLNHLSEGAKPWAVFSVEIPDKKFYNFVEVRDAINELTDKVCGVSKDIVDKPIVLNVYSPTCPDLTLVDLPGITKIAIAGQRHDIEKVTRAMCHRYMSDSRTIILCVVPANADMTTSDGLQMARNLDKNGIRTIGVITKVDIMDRGTNAKRMIMNQDVTLRLGYVGVKNRAQEDIINQLSVKDAQDKENMFFNTHPIYSSMPPGFLGCETLISKLTKILFTHIKFNLPEIIREIREKQRETETELVDLGAPMPSSQEDKKHLLWNMIAELVQTYKNQIQGKWDARRLPAVGGQQKSELSGGAKIKRGFYSLYGEFENFNATQEYSDMAIERAIAMHEGDSIPGFPSVDVFHYLIQPQLEKLREPALELI
jgi:vacuolar protein sorting-associated protein 1